LPQAVISPVDTHAFKRSLHHSERYNRRGFGRAEEVAGSLEQAYQSDLVANADMHLEKPVENPTSKTIWHNWVLSCLMQT
jgi:hypothetical protein